MQIRPAMAVGLAMLLCFSKATQASPLRLVGVEGGTSGVSSTPVRSPAPGTATAATAPSEVASAPRFDPNALRAYNTYVTFTLVASNIPERDPARARTQAAALAAFYELQGLRAKKSLVHRNEAEALAAFFKHWNSREAGLYGNVQGDLARLARDMAFSDLTRYVLEVNTGVTLEEADFSERHWRERLESCTPTFGYYYYYRAVHGLTVRRLALIRARQAAS